MSRVGLHFNGTNTYCKIPVSVSSAQSWEVILSISTDSDNKYGNAVYNQPCIFGYDSAGYISRDFHIDLKNGNLYIFSGLGGTNTSAQINCGTLTISSDAGWDTGKNIADSSLHIIRAVYADSKITVYLDGENLGYLNTAYTINSSNLYLGCSQTGEKKYASYNLYDFALKIDGVDSVVYAPDDADIALNKLTDMSGNSNDGALYGTASSVNYMVAFDTERVVSGAINVSYLLDTERKIVWRYGNPGLINDLINTSTAVQLSDLPSTKSKFGIAFYQTTTGIKIFDVPSASEIWIKFDVYFNGSQRWRVYDISTNPSNNSTTGITAQTSGAISLFNQSTNVGQYNNKAKANTLQTFILHMRADSSSGLIEAYSQDGGLIGQYTSAVNSGVAFSNLYVQSDGSGTFFSNIIISSDELTFNDNCAYFGVDLERELLPKSITLNFDLMRMTHVPATQWRYENIGLISDLINTSNAVQLSNLPASQSKTGVAYYQSEYYKKTFDVADSSEYWIRFDVYNATNEDVFVGDGRYDEEYEEGDPIGIVLFNISLIVEFGGDNYDDIYHVGSEQIESYLLHIKSGVFDGFGEAYSAQGGLLSEYTGNVNDGNDFTHLTATGSSDNFLSNIVISNQPLWLDDSAILNKSIDYYADCQRKTEIDLTLTNDAERIVVTGIAVDYLIDMERAVYLGTSINYQADTEREIVVSVSYLIDAERIVSDGELTSFTVDMIRMVSVPATAWRYENIGKISGLHNTTSAVQLTDLPRTQSRYGMAFYSGLYDKNIFNGTQTSREIWMRFDVYRNGSNRSWHLGARNYNSTNEGIVGLYTDSVYPERNRFFISSVDAEADSADNTAKVNELQSVLIYAVGDLEADGGLMEVYTNSDGLIYSHRGDVNDAEIFNEFNAFGTSNAFFSNVIISNQPIWLDENATMSEPVSLSFDVDRRVGNTVNIVNDLERILLAWTDNILLSFDINRDVVQMPILAIDAERELYCNLSLSIDAERFIVGAAYTINLDMIRQVGNRIIVLYDKERFVNNTVIVPLDSERELIRIENFYVDIARYLPYQLSIDGTETTVIPMASNDAGIQSINILMSEQQVTDRVSFVHAGHCNIMDKIQGTYRDYEFDLRIEETDRQGVIQSCNCCSDIDELLYSQIAYTIPENKYEWSQDYLDMLGVKQQENPDEEIEAQPTTTAEEHLRMIAQKMGKNLIYRGVKFYSTNNVNENGGKTYASVISELIGWSSRLPQMEINAYFRGDTMYVIQRGFESNTVSLDGAKIANLRVNQKLVRTTWGSDVKSESVVDTFINNWQELELEPYNPSESGGSTSTYGDDNLVETTTTESETEKSETTYHYDIGENGEKYLAYEETIKYEKDTRGNWQEYDRIVTTHDRVSMTQSHIYAESEDGTIVGEVVSPNRFDDRATPYDKGHGGGGRGFVLMHDGQGNQYKCYSIKYFSEEMEKGTRTTYGLSLVDTSFPIYGEANLTYLTQQLMWLNRKIEETISMDIYDVNHVIGFDDKISYNGGIYHLKSNNILQNEHIINKQSIEMVRWI